jgi:hypothetical protein
METKASNSLVAKLDNNDYDEADLIEMRVSLNLPYQNDQSEFERINGEIEINGTHYNYVKRRIDKGELVVMCIPNQSKTRIENSRTDYFKLVNDLQQEGQGKKSEKSTTGSFKGLFSEYSECRNDWSIKSPVNAVQRIAEPDFDIISAFSFLLPGQPPELA